MINITICFKDLTERKQQEFLNMSQPIFGDYNTIEIYLNDLTESKQKEILDKLGDMGCYDNVPFTTIYVSYHDIESLRASLEFNEYEESEGNDNE